MKTFLFFRTFTFCLLVYRHPGSQSSRSVRRHARCALATKAFLPLTEKKKKKKKKP